MYNNNNNNKYCKMIKFIINKDFITVVRGMTLGI